MSIGQRLKEMREDANLTQEDLASRIGKKSAGTIGNYEQGVNKIDLDTLLDLSKVLEQRLNKECFLYLATGRRFDEYSADMDQLNSKGYLHISEVTKNLRNVLVSAIHLKLIKIPYGEKRIETIISSLVDSFEEAAKP